MPDVSRSVDVGCNVTCMNPLHDPTPYIRLYAHDPTNFFSLSQHDLTTILDALSHARTNDNIRADALRLELRLIDWADMNASPDA